MSRRAYALICWLYERIFICVVDHYTSCICPKMDILYLCKTEQLYNRNAQKGAKKVGRTKSAGGSDEVNERPP